MSINHFSTDLPETLWWSQQQRQQSIMEPNPNTSSSQSHKPIIPHPSSSSWPSLPYQHQSWLNSYNPQEPSSMFPTENPTLNFNLNHEDDEEQDQEEQPEQHQHNQHLQELEKEHLFEKPLTPSDVGKLNRLVIPKQHAEKYFPLGGDSGDKGLLLSFEDEAGKCWRFRYSYWNSSQSYVLTKGWSRYVKEKQLDAGDVVLFERHRRDGDRLFIGWRRRGGSHSSGGMMVQGGSGGVWSRGLYSSSSLSSAGHQPYPTSIEHGHGATVTSSSVPYQPDCLHAGSVAQMNQLTPLGNSKRLRLFGVNLECQLDESEPSTPDGSSLSSQGPAYHQQFYSQSAAFSSNSQTHMVQIPSQEKGSSSGGGEANCRLLEWRGNRQDHR